MRPPPDTPSQPAPSPAAGESVPTIPTSPPAVAGPSTGDLSSPDTDAPGATPPLPAPARRYLLCEEIGRGGMGAVLRARDPQLGRDLAVKVLRGDGHASPESLRRFVEEAQVCGQLQHPSIVPVLDLGRLEDGRPFFAMKLIRGRLRHPLEEGVALVGVEARPRRPLPARSAAVVAALLLLPSTASAPAARRRG